MRKQTYIETEFILFPLYKKDYKEQSYNEHLLRFAEDEKYRKEVFEYLDKKVQNISN